MLSTENSFQPAFRALTLTLLSMVPSCFPLLLLLTNLPAFVLSKSGDQCKGESLLQHLNFSRFAASSLNWVQCWLSLGSDSWWGSNNIQDQAFNQLSFTLNELKCLWKVLVFGCWSTRAELAGLTQPEKVARLQGILNTQVLTICFSWQIVVILSKLLKWSATQIPKK